MAKKPLITVIVHSPGCGCFGDDDESDGIGNDNSSSDGGGSSRRPMAVSQAEFDRRWNQAFPGSDRKPAYARKRGEKPN